MMAMLARTENRFSNDQSAAIRAFEDFRDSDASTFALLGYAGTGKTFTMSHLLDQFILPRSDSFRGSRTETIFATPTHKATWVARRFLTESDIRFEIGFDYRRHKPGRLITGTTSALLGVMPTIVEDQSTKREFEKQGEGIIEKLRYPLEWIVIDEVSMLSLPDLKEIETMAKARGAKVLIIGDPGQLPPVNKPPIKWDALTHGAILQQIMRTENGSAIPLVAQAIRSDEDWWKVKGLGVDHFDDPAGAYLEELDGPPAWDERERTVFIAYTNQRVNAVQQAACLKVYGHGRGEFRDGEIVTATRPLYRNGDPLCQNGDTLQIVTVTEPDAEGYMTGTFKSANDPNVFRALFLTEASLRDKGHPFNVKTRELFNTARRLQTEYNAAKRTRAAGVNLDRLDAGRRLAWTDYFKHVDETLISAVHGFAITSHKAQGSTYRQVFVDAKDIEPFSRNGLYVAATRPSEELIIG
jgi:hypothetical protein